MPETLLPELTEEEKKEVIEVVIPRCQKLALNKGFYLETMTKFNEKLAVYSEASYQLRYINKPRIAVWWRFAKDGVEVHADFLDEINK
jgi:hypothetical protein